MSDRLEAAGFAFTSKQVAQIVALSGKLKPYIAEIELMIGKPDPSVPGVSPIPAAQPSDHGCELFRRYDQAASTIAQTTHQLSATLAAMPEMLRRELEGDLAYWWANQSPERVVEANSLSMRDYGAWKAAVGPVALAQVNDAIGALQAAIRRAQRRHERRNARGRPARREELIIGLSHIVEDAHDLPDNPDWEADWKPWAAPQGRFCRLVGICLDAIGRPSHSNIPQLIRRQLAQDVSYSREMDRDDALRRMHNEHKCDPTTCEYCS